MHDARILETRCLYHCLVKLLILILYQIKINCALFYQVMCVLKNVPKPAMQFYNVEEFLQMYDLVTFNLVCPITITMSSYYYVFIS